MTHSDNEVEGKRVGGGGDKHWWLLGKLHQHFVVCTDGSCRTPLAQHLFF